MSVIFGGSADDAQALRELEGVPLGLPGGLELSWLGVSGYRLTYEGVSLFIDPYVSRVPLRSLLLRRLAMPDESIIDRYAGAPGGGGRAGRPHALRSRARRARDRAPLRGQGVRVAVVGAFDAPAWPR